MDEKERISESHAAKSRAYHYGKVLSTRRKEMKITQQNLAEDAGMARSYISRVERGKADIQLSSFLRIAEALKLSVKLVPVGSIKDK